MKKVFIIHGWSESSEEPLYKWLTSELTERGFKVEALDMPNSDEPEINAWVTKLNKTVGKEPNENTIFIGHSIASQTILRYLETTSDKTKIGGAVFLRDGFASKV